MTLPFLVQVARELYASDNPRSRPPRPGRPTNGMLQLKLRESGSSPPPPVRFRGSRRAVDEPAEMLSSGPEFVLTPLVDRSRSCSMCIFFISVPLFPVASV